MKLIIDWDEFKQRLDTYLSEGKELNSSNSSINTEDQLQKLKSDIKNWRDKVVNYLRNSFDEQQNDFATSFHNARQERFFLSKNKEDCSTLIRKQLEDLQVKIEVLEYYPKILSVCDAIIRPEEIDLEERSKFDTDQTLDLLLDKLYEIYDSNYHSISTILTGNGIQLRTKNDGHELAQALEDYGYISISPYKSNNTAQLTIEGRRYVEEKRKAQKPDYSQITQNPEELNQKINELRDELKKLGCGQQIIFEELEDLRKLYTLLNQKNWGEILKGKLIDLGLNQVINKKVMTLIFEELTQQTLKLP